MTEASSSTPEKFFAAIVVPEPIQEQIQQLKRDCQDLTGTRAALRSPSHITFHMPFHWRADRVSHLTNTLRSWKMTAPIRSGLRGFGCFPPRVVFIQVEESKELIETHRLFTRFCRTSLGLLNAHYKDQPFHPHVTIAFRDLNKSEFNLLWADFGQRTFESEFVATHLTLLRHNSKEWKPFQDFGAPS